MKILLIQPAKAQKTIGGEDVFIYEPLALEYLASGVKEDHENITSSISLLLDFLTHHNFLPEPEHMQRPFA